MTEKIITRFAPSPTGFLHIGGARTALFNWLFAKSNGGKMLLRIEDTDRKRSSDQAVEAILDGLSWLGIAGDEDPISQYARRERHAEICQALLARDHAYKCYASPDELTQLREKSRLDNSPLIYEWRDKDPMEAPADISPVIRLKAPRTGTTIILDEVQGEVKFANQELDDMVLLRSDGSATYMLAVVVDDHDMGITHIIRGDDHLTNAARQILIYNAMDWKNPVMAHIPLIHGSDGAKLSKRHGALGVDAYRMMGYLPEAINNYLVRLGWSHGDDEIISIKQMIEWFGFNGMGKSASRFDFDKLANLNVHYMRETLPEKLMEYLETHANEIENAAYLGSIGETERQLLIKAMPLLTTRAKTLCDLAGAAKFVVSSRPIKLDEKAEKILAEPQRELLRLLLPDLEKLNNWTHSDIGEVVANFCENQNLKLGKIAPALRCAIAGTMNAPGVFEVMELFGRDETILRLKDQI